MTQFELQYKVSCSWRNVNFYMENPSTDIELIEINSDGNEIIINIRVLSDTSDNAKKNGEEYVNQILDRFIFVCEQKFSEPELQHITDLISGIQVNLSRAEILGSMTVVCTMTDQQKEEVEDRLLNSESVYYRLFSIALKQDDIVARFMFLFSIILKIYQDKQIGVDKFIIENGYSGALSPRRSSTVGETVFTIIRNNLGHPGRDPNLNMVQIRKDMISNVNELAKYVKLAIIHDLEQA